MVKYLFVFLFVVMSCLASFGQQEEWGTKDVPKRMDWWIGASAGSTVSFADNAASNNFAKNFPTLDIQLGTFFTKFLGARIGGSMGPQSGRADADAIEIDPTKYRSFYRFYVMQAYADAMLDLTTLFAPRRKYRPTVDVMLFAGPGLIEALHFDMKLKDWDVYPVDYQDKTCWTLHVGLMTAYRFSPHWDWSFEASYNITESRYDGVEENTSTSGFLKLHTGFIYHFFDRKSNRVRLTTDIDSEWAPRYTEKDRENALKAERKRIEKAQKETSKRRATKNETIKKHNEDVKKANEQIRKAKEKRAKEWEEKKKYNELVY